MKKMTSKITVFILSLILAFTFVGCKGSGQGSTPNYQGPNTSIVTPDAPSLKMTESKTLILGETFLLNPEVKNVEGDLVWSTSNSSVATISNGLVTAVGAGTAQITVSIGELFAKCNITVSYGDFKPELYPSVSMEDGNVTISMGGNFYLSPYIKYNGTTYNDAEYTYSTSDDSVATIENGVITGVGAGTAIITVSANWRDFNASEEPFLTKTITVEVKDDVVFLVNGDIARGFSLTTPAKFLSESERNNTVQIKPTVKVNGGEIVDVTDVTLTPVGNIVSGVDYTFHKIGERYIYTALALGDSLVTLKYVLDGDVHVCNFYISATRPTKVIEDRIEYFNLKAGTIKIKEDGVLKTSTLVEEFWSEGVTLYDAYDENGTAIPFSSDGRILQVLDNNAEGYGETTVTLGTKTEIYEIPLRTAGHFIFDKEDLVSALNANPYSVDKADKGYYVLMNDIDMEGTIVNAYLTGGFYGIFDGRGHVIYNLVSDTTSYTVDGVSKRGGGLFNVLKGTVKNVAFVNLKGIQKGSHSYVGLLGREFDFGLMENVYIDVNPETLPKGVNMFYLIGNVGAPTIKNVVINYPGAKGYAWSEQEYIENCEQSGWCANRGSLGAVLISYKENNGSFTLSEPVKAENLTVISPMPLYHGTPSTIPSGYTSKVDSTDWFLYGENETELWYQHSFLDEFDKFNAGKHTVATAGEWAGQVYRFKVNQKVRVVSGIRRYDSISDLISDNSEDSQKSIEKYAESGYFVIVDGAPIWHKLVGNYTSVTANGKEVIGSFDLNCYSQAEIQVVAQGQSAEQITLSEGSDLISVSGNKVIASKVGNGATLTINYVWGGKSYTKTVTINVLNPFNVYADDKLVEQSYSKLLGSTVDLKVKIGNTAVSGVTFSESVDGLSISGNTLSVDKVVENAKITAKFTYQGTAYELSILFNTIDPVSESATITKDGSLVNDKFEIDISDEVLVGISIPNKTANVISLDVDSDKFNINGDKISAVGYGEGELVIIFEVDGKSHKKVVPVATVWETQSVKNEVLLDAHESEVKYNYDGKILQALISYDGEEILLTEENGGILNGKLNFKGENQDGLGVPYITAKNLVSTMKLTLFTDVKVYELSVAQYATFVIENAQEYELALDYGDYNYEGIGNGSFEYKLHDGIYVLGNDIDMTGVTIENRIDFLTFATPEYKISASNVGFTGIFDGRGHTVSNVTLLVGRKYTYVNNGQYGNIPAGHKNHMSYGLFHSVAKGAVIKNVAYMNVLATNNNATTNSLTGIIARSFAGTLENVLIDVNAQTKTKKGVAFSLDSTAKLKNVVVNFLTPSDYEFDYNDATTNTSETANYVYGYGSLAGSVNKSTQLENVYVASKYPLTHATDAKANTTDTNDYFTYGANESTLWFNHTANEGKSFEELVVEHSSTDESLVRRLSGVRRYDYFEDIVKDTSESNATTLESLTSSNYFKVLNGKIMWYNHKLTETVDSLVTYDASTNTLNTTKLPSDVKSITVNGIELTEENGGLIKSGNSYKLRAKTSAQDELAGVPFMVKGDNQVLNFTVDAGDVVYNFTNVVYWTKVITTAQQFKDTFSLGVYDASKVYEKEVGLYTLGNNIDMSVLGEGNIIQNNVRYQSIPGDNSANSWKFATEFAGIFDGGSFAVKNVVVDLNAIGNYNHSGGLFGIISGGEIRNVAFINIKAQKTTNLYQGLLSHTMQSNARIENVYIEINKDSANVPLWNAINYTKAHIKNLVVNVPMKDGYEWNDDTYADISVGGWKTQYGIITPDINNLSTIENVYVISPSPVSYSRPSSKPAAGTAHLANGWGDSDALDKDIFFYGENETKLWYSHTVLDTLDPANQGKHTVQTVVANNAKGKARVISGLRRYDDFTALTLDTSKENKAMFDALIKTKLWIDVDGIPVWKSTVS